MPTLPQSLSGLIGRELRTLKREIDAYPDEADLWRLPPGVPNSGGTLALHLVGNLRHFVGARLGATGYVRDRDAEFARRDVPRADLLRLIDETIAEVDRSFAGLDAGALAAPFPQRIADWQVDTQDWLLHLIAHLGYHLGQVDLHRRVVTGDPRGVDAVAVGEIPGATKE